MGSSIECESGFDAPWRGLLSACLTIACTRQSRLSHLVLAHKLRQSHLQVKLDVIQS